MQAGQSPAPAREARKRYRHELRTLAYVTLDQANGGIVRNLTHDGIAVQAVTSVRPRQQLRVRLELRYPRLRVDTNGEVVWSTFSGRCGIRFLNLPPQIVRQIDEWIFGNLLDGLSLHSDVEASIFNAHTLSRPAPAALESAQHTSPSARMTAAQPLLAYGRQSEVIAALPEQDRFITSPGSVKFVDLPLPDASREAVAQELEDPEELDWFSQPLSGRSLVWTVNALAVVAAWLLFAVIFLSVTRETPRWPGTTISGAAVAVTTLYWGFFRMFGGTSLGVRLARLAEATQQEPELENTRFR
jgi:hypothetical protein